MRAYKVTPFHAGRRAADWPGRRAACGRLPGGQLGGPARGSGGRSGSRASGLQAGRRMGERAGRWLPGQPARWLGTQDRRLGGRVQMGARVASLPAGGPSSRPGARLGGRAARRAGRAFPKVPMRRCPVRERNEPSNSAHACFLPRWLCVICNLGVYVP